MKRFILGLGLAVSLWTAGLSDPDSMTEVVRDVVVELPGVGNGLIVSSDGTLVVPSQVLGSQKALSIPGVGSKVEASFTDPKHSFAVFQLPPGDYYTVELGDLSLVQEGDFLTSTAGKCEVLDMETDLSRNEQFAVVSLPYRMELLGMPVFNSEGKAVALVVGEGSSGPDHCKVLSCRSVKLALFEAGWKPLKSRLHPLLSGGGSADGPAIGPGGRLNPTLVETWDFPFGTEGTTRTGTLLNLQEWRYNTGTQGARVAPLLVDEQQHLYLVTLQGTVYCLDFAARQMLWRSPLGPGGVVLSSPLKVGGKLVVTSGSLGLWSLGKGRTGALSIDLFQDIAGRAKNSLSLNSGKLFALEDHGNEAWTLPTRFPSPSLLVGKRIIFSGLGVLGVVEAESGQLLWFKEKPQGRSRAIWYSVQAVEGNLAYGFSLPVKVHGGIDSDERLHLEGEDDLSVFCLDVGTGREKWSRELPKTRSSFRPLGVRLDLSEGLVHLTQAERRLGLQSLDGAPVYRYDRKDRALSDRAVMAEGVFYGTDEESLYALKAERGDLLWRVPLSGSVAAPILADGVLYVTTHHSLSAFDEATGKMLWNYDCENRLSGQPALRDGFLYAASLEGRLFRVRLPEY